jgi:hypothetical protein
MWEAVVTYSGAAYAHQYLLMLEAWLRTHQGQNFMMTMIFGLIIIVLVYTWGEVFGPKIKWKKRGITMTPEERKLFVREKIEDVITDGIEDLVLNKTITSAEAQTWYRRIGGMKGLPGLLPKATKKYLALPADFVKAEIKERLKSAAHKPVTLPDGKAPRPARKGRLSQMLHSI